MAIYDFNIEFDTEEDKEYHSVLEAAMEAAGHTISEDTRDALPDKAFGIIYKDDEGKTQRKYPLVVKSDPEATKQLQGKAIAFFHFCAPQYKKELAKNIVKAILSSKSGVKISEKSQINEYVKVPEELFGKEAKFDKKNKK